MLGLFQEPVIAREKHLGGTGFGRGEMGSIQRSNSLRVDGVRTVFDLRGRCHIFNGSVVPQTDFVASVWFGMSRILKGEHRRSNEAVESVHDPVQDAENGLCLSADSCLPLVIKGPVETVQVHIEPHLVYSFAAAVGAESTGFISHCQTLGT